MKRRISAAQRPIRSVPRWVLRWLLIAILGQCFLHSQQPTPRAVARDLPTPPGLAVLQAVSLGEPVVLAKLLMLWLQAFDNQPGISIPFRDLDYLKVQAWLTRILELDPRADYPLLAASRLYAEVPVPAMQRQMMDFVHAQFLLAPNRRWRWLAHVAILARHRLQDTPLALRYARSLAQKANGAAVPDWARFMALLLLEDQGEYAAASVMIGALLDSGQVRDAHELQFLRQKLEQLRVAESKE